jgi:hypothetical protein
VIQQYEAEMRIRLVIPTLLVALLAACSGSSAGASASANPPASQGQASSAQGAVDCAAITTAAQELIMVQFLAQLKTADTIEAVKTRQIGNLDLDKFLAAMHTLHALDSHPGVLGDPKPAIDFYEKAAKAAQVLFATVPMTQAAIDTYNQNVGTITEFLGHQSAISAAMGEAGC